MPRALWVPMLITACSFEHGWQAPTGDAAATGDDAHRDAPSATADAYVGDATPADAALTMCQAHATDTFNGHYYFATANHLTLVAAETECVTWDARLVKITSSAENAFVTASFVGMGSSDSAYTWIGLTDPFDNDIYVWMDGSFPLLYNAFPQGQFPSSDNNCADTNGTWRTFDCGQTAHGGTCECN